MSKKRTITEGELNNAISNARRAERDRCATIADGVAQKALNDGILVYSEVARKIGDLIRQVGLPT